MFNDLVNFSGGLFDDFRRAEEQLNELFGRWPGQSGIRSVSRGSYPPINIGATTDSVSVYLFAAGLDPETLDISIQQNLLTVTGERNTQAEENANYYRRERFSGTFHRVITLPEDVDPDNVNAQYRDGVLQVSIQRQEATRPRQIEVHAA